MKGLWQWSAMLSLALLAQCSSAQGGPGGFGGGGFGGGGFGGGGFGGQEGGRGTNVQTNNQNITNTIQTYLTGDFSHSILTPGEFTEWKLELKPGQVVIAEATSDSFDPALEIVDANSKVLAFNDDRYPGDQRPLLLWRCLSAGTYLLHTRCFRDKAGGPVDMRYRVFDSTDLPNDGTVDRVVTDTSEHLYRAQLKRGQVVQFVSNPVEGQPTVLVTPRAIIGPLGLPDPGLLAAFRNVLPNALIAPLDGDYYFLGGRDTALKATVRVGLRFVDPIELKWDGHSSQSDGQSGVTSLYSVKLKRGDLVQVTTPTLMPATEIVASIQPETPDLDPKKPEANPFYPKLLNPDSGEEAPIVALTGRARDGRVHVFQAMKDATVWIGVVPRANTSDRFPIVVKSVATELATGVESPGLLKIGDHAYWSFEAKVGDVMRFSAKVKGFSGQLVLRDPSLNDTWNRVADVDSDSLTTTRVISVPGRYLLEVAADGDGGSGPYTLKREVFQAKDFGKGRPAVGDLSDGQVQVWRFTAKPNDPILVHWTSSDWTYSISCRTQDGTESRLALLDYGKAGRYGILSVTKSTDYVLVLVPGASKAKYKIELLDLPGFKDGGD